MARGSIVCSQAFGLEAHHERGRVELHATSELTCSRADTQQRQLARYGQALSCGMPSASSPPATALVSSCSVTSSRGRLSGCMWLVDYDHATTLRASCGALQAPKTRGCCRQSWTKAPQDVCQQLLDGGPAELRATCSCQLGWDLSSSARASGGLQPTCAPDESQQAQQLCQHLHSTLCLHALCCSLHCSRLGW